LRERNAASFKIAIQLPFHHRATTLPTALSDAGTSLVNPKAVLVLVIRSRNVTNHHLDSQTYSKVIQSNTERHQLSTDPACRNVLSTHRTEQNRTTATAVFSAAKKFIGFISLIKLSAGECSVATLFFRI